MSKIPEQLKKYPDECYGVKIRREGKNYYYQLLNKKNIQGNGSEQIMQIRNIKKIRSTELKDSVLNK